MHQWLLGAVALLVVSFSGSGILIFAAMFATYGATVTAMRYVVVLFGMMIACGLLLRRWVDDLKG